MPYPFKLTMVTEDFEGFENTDVSYYMTLEDAEEAVAEAYFAEEIDDGEFVIDWTIEHIEA